MELAHFKVETSTLLCCIQVVFVGNMQNEIAQHLYDFRPPKATSHRKCNHLFTGS